MTNSSVGEKLSMGMAFVRLEGRNVFRIPLDRFSDIRHRDDIAGLGCHVFPPG
ncbi:MAG: hypothetical protein IIA75_00095 [Proteobacteria bacterium]|nr:hypothetical protein [Pseudomonadota bacterium]